MGKLIRDGVPGLVREAGGAIETRQLNDCEFEVALRAKLVEEANEVAEAPSEHLLEELGDVFEVLTTLAAQYGLTLAEITDAANAKRQTHGGFDERLTSESFTPPRPTA